VFPPSTSPSLIIMLEGDFREPLMVDEYGLYITISQMEFFLNRKHGEELVNNASPEFMKYYKNCCLYNLVYDMMEEDPDCAKMYWDDVTESVAMAFPMDGKVAKALASVAIHFAEVDEEDDDDEFGLFD
jgi:hypothetical protein